MTTPVQRAAWVTAGISGMLSVVIPARNECENLRPTIAALVATLDEAAIRHEIIVVDDHSDDGTAVELVSLQRDFPTLRHVSNEDKGGFGLAVRAGLDTFCGASWQSFFAVVDSLDLELFRENDPAVSFLAVDVDNAHAGARIRCRRRCVGQNTPGQQFSCRYRSFTP
jgi:glycosyltransferase involved in cell wall biosynthesis